MGRVDGGRGREKEKAMPDKDSLTREYISQPNVFAEIFNYLIYGGVQVIQPGQLEEADTRQTLVLGGKGSKKTMERYRDLFRKLVAMTDGEKVLALLGIENQTEIDYGMPARIMLYDAISYDILMRKAWQDVMASGWKGPFTSSLPRERHIQPVLTGVIYFGTTPWDAPVSLREMIDFPDESFRDLVPDYRLNLMAPAFIPESHLGLFKTDIPLLARFLRCAGDGESLERLLESDESFNSVDGLMAGLLNGLTNSNLPINKTKGKTNMCKAIDDIRSKSRAEGIATGRAEGIATGRAEGIATGRAEGIAEGIATGRAEEQTAIIAQIIRYQLTKNIAHGDLVETLTGVFHLSASDAEQRIRQVMMA